MYWQLSSIALLCNFPSGLLFSPPRSYFQLNDQETTTKSRISVQY